MGKKNRTFELVDIKKKKKAVPRQVKGKQEGEGSFQASGMGIDKGKETRKDKLPL